MPNIKPRQKPKTLEEAAEAAPVDTNKKTKKAVTGSTNFSVSMPERYTKIIDDLIEQMYLLHGVKISRSTVLRNALDELSRLNDEALAKKILGDM